MNKGEVYFGLFGADFDPFDAKRVIKIDWAVVKLRGDPIPKRSSWRCSTGKYESDLLDVYDLSSGLISRINPHVQQIVEVKKRFQLDAVLQVVLTISGSDDVSTPAIGFDEEVLAFVCRVGGVIDIDTYRD